jgi:hypothetical protein
MKVVIFLVNIIIKMGKEKDNILDIIKVVKIKLNKNEKN